MCFTTSMEVFYVVRRSSDSAFYVVPANVFQNTMFNVVCLPYCLRCGRSTVVVLRPILVPVDIVFYAVPVQRVRRH